MKELPVRKHPRLKEYDYSGAGFYYVTICTYNKQPILSRVFKSMSTRLCNQYDNIEGGKTWQTSFYDKVITSEEAYRPIYHYI